MSHCCSKPEEEGSIQKADRSRDDWQNLSKKEKRRLKKEQKRLEREREARKSRLKKWSLIFGSAVLIVGSFFLFDYLNKTRYENAPKIKVSPLTHNFGKVLAFEGTVETTFEIKNVGVAPLAVSGIKTSCGCTKAKFRMGGEESPEFGMHDGPPDWSVSIEPESTAELTVVFDPNFHEKTSGPVTRFVSIFSDDPSKKEEKVTIYADVQR